MKKKLFLITLILIELMNFINSNAQCNELKNGVIKYFKPTPIVLEFNYGIGTAIYFNTQTNDSFIALFCMNNENKKIIGNVTFLLNNNKKILLQNESSNTVYIDNKEVYLTFYTLNDDVISSLSKNSIKNIIFNLENQIINHSIDLNNKIFIEQINCLKIIKNYSNTELNDKAIEEKKKHLLELSKTPETIQETIDYSNRSDYNQVNKSKPYFSSSDKELLSALKQKGRVESSSNVAQQIRYNQATTSKPYFSNTEESKKKIPTISLSDQDIDQLSFEKNRFNKYNNRRDPYFSTINQDNLDGSESYNGSIDIEELSTQRHEEKTKNLVVLGFVLIVGGASIFLIYKKF